MDFSRLTIPWVLYCLACLFCSEAMSWSYLLTPIPRPTEDSASKRPPPTGYTTGSLVQGTSSAASTNQRWESLSFLIGYRKSCDTIKLYHWFMTYTITCTASLYRFSVEKHRIEIPCCIWSWPQQATLSLAIHPPPYPVEDPIIYNVYIDDF